MASKVFLYFEKLRLSFGELPESGPVFYGVNQEHSGYLRQPMGQHYLAAIGKDMVQFLNLNNPSEYIGKHVN